VILIPVWPPILIDFRLQVEDKEPHRAFSQFAIPVQTLKNGLDICQPHRTPEFAIALRTTYRRARQTFLAGELVRDPDEESAVRKIW
jgi:hypothetical protein